LTQKSRKKQSIFEIDEQKRCEKLTRVCNGVKNSEDEQRVAAAKNVASHSNPVHREVELVLVAVPRRVQRHDHRIGTAQTESTHLARLVPLSLGLGLVFGAPFLFAKIASNRRRDWDRIGEGSEAYSELKDK